MFTQRAFIHHYLAGLKDNLAWRLSMGDSRFPNAWGKYDDISTAARMFDLELEVRHLQQVADAWDIIERKGITCPIVRNAIKIPVQTIVHKYYPGMHYLELDDIQNAAAVAILVN